jgi:hypothetical protein
MLKSIVPFKNRLNIFYITAILLCVVYFMYVGAYKDLRASVVSAAIFFVIEILIVNTVIVKLLLYFMGKNKYYLPTGTSIESVNKALSDSGFKTRIVNSSVLVKKSSAYYVNLKSDGAFTVSARWFYRRALRDIPAIVSVIQNGTIQNYEALTNLKVKNCPVNNRTKIIGLIFAVGLCVGCIVFSFVLAGYIGVEKRLNDYKRYAVATNENIAEKSLKNFGELTYPSEEIENVVDDVCYFRTQIPASNNILLVYYLWSENGGKCHFYQFAYDTENEKFIAAELDYTKLVTKPKQLEKTFYKMIKKGDGSINSRIREDCTFLYNNLPDTDDLNTYYICECNGMSNNGDSRFTVYKLTKYDDMKVASQIYGNYYCNKQKNKIVIK